MTLTTKEVHEIVSTKATTTKMIQRGVDILARHLFILKRALNSA